MWLASKGDHGAGNPTAKVVDEMAGPVCFAARALNAVPN